MLRLNCRGGDTPAWARPEGMPDAIWRLLAGRGIDSAEQARAFLSPSERDLIPPMKLSGMAEAVGRIRAAQAAKETVCVWGDYDVDGVSAAAILVSVLTGMGVNAYAYIPSRHDEGYGLNEPGIIEVAKSASLLITVDCGISACALVERAKALGLSVIVTDHHRPGEALPDCTVVNPLLGDYENRFLCGAGVAFKLAQALDEALAAACIDLAALATVADVVSLTGENRAIVALGLKAMNARPRPGIAALMAVSGARPGGLTAGHLGFQLGPRLNAGGRVGSARRSYELLCASSMEEAAPLAKALDAENTARKAIEQLILKDAQAQLASYDLARMRVIVLAGDDWNPGVIGLAASRLVERYHLPTVLLGGGETLTGSCRSIPGVDVFACLSQVKELLVRYGGHKQAAGLSIARANIDAFRAALNDIVERTTDPDAFIPSADYDLALPLEAADLALARALEALAPTGMGNPAPVFLSNARVSEARAIGQDGAHLKLTLTGEADDEAELSGVWFGAGGRTSALNGRAWPVLYALKVNEFRDNVTPQAEVKAVAPPSLRRALCVDRAGEARLLHEYLTKMCYNMTSHTAPEARAIADEQVIAYVRSEPRGTLIACADVRGAKRLLAELSDAGLTGRLDVYEGSWPDDRRAFNALCLLPPGAPPEGYRRMIAVSAPARLLAAGFSGDAYELGGCAEWVRLLPDKNDLRAVYVAVRALLKRPYAGSDAFVVARELEEASGVPAATAHAALYALRQLDLIAFEPGVRALAMRPMKRVPPEESQIFRFYMDVRTWGGDEYDGGTV